MNETTFFEYGDVKVTNARFVTGGQTFAMNNVTSVKTNKKPPRRVLGILVLVMSLMGAAVPPHYYALAVAAAAALYLYQQKTIYHVMLTTAGGESSALKTHQLAYITKVVGALNEAIIHRG